MNRREFLKQAGAIGSGMAFNAACLDAKADGQPSSRPNVLILKSDEHNPFFSSVYGHPFVRTPNMERLARWGTVYENNYTPSPLCLPARSSWLSGRYVHEIQCYNNCNVIPHEYPSYGRVLQDQGIHTVHVGKVDGYNRSETLGFSEMLRPDDRARPGDRVISRHPLAIRTGDGPVRANGWGVRPTPFAADNGVIRAATNWLENTATKLDRPWTLDVNIVAPHFPVYVTQELWDMYPQGGDLPRYGRDQESARHPYAEDLRRHFETDQTSEEQTRGIRRGYLGCITEADRQLGKLLDVLERTGLLQNTIVAYTSDHGDMMGKFGMWWKCSLYEDSARVPLIVAGPGFRAGARVKTPTNLLDLQAGIFRALGAKRPAHWAGKPLQDIPINDTHRALFTEYHGHGTRGSAYMIRKGRWKLIWCAEAPHQLFDLQAAPEELHNLAEERPKVVTELTADLRKICDPQQENDRAEAFIRRQIALLRESAPRSQPFS